MNATRRRRASTVALRKSAELAWAAPQVVAHRMARMAAAGPNLSDRDRKEFELMGAEKAQAFHEAWMAMGLQAWQMQQSMAINFWRAFWLGMGGTLSNPWAGFDQASLRLLNKGLAPVHRRAVANARRLGRGG